MIFVAYIHRDQCNDATEHKDYSCHKMNCALLDALADPLAKLNCSHSADKMTKACSDCDHDERIGSAESDGCYLRAVSPFCKERHREGLPHDQIIWDNGIQSFVSLRLIWSFFTFGYPLYQLLVHLLQLLLHFFQFLAFIHMLRIAFVVGFP